MLPLSKNVLNNTNDEAEIIYYLLMRKVHTNEYHSLTTNARLMHFVGLSMYRR
jgi:hypothetical protein